MTQLAPFVFTLTAILAFSEVSAYRTTITTPTTIEDNGHGSHMDILDNPRTSQAQCPKLTGETNCHAHILRDIHFRRPNQDFQQSLEMCCTDLKKVTKQCQCDTIHQTYDKALKKLSMEKFTSKCYWMRLRPSLRTANWKSRAANSKSQRLIKMNVLKE
ncbi:hypothetical protein L1987_01108 [Smallanthus sonchifolius]|uniref:Uncharacterized protein n=1 Tax=Smallanthus sonchifolius TaxID=185202 RepID=A0ACB9K449_9ASTR|nr:hypothetical protein L1987_01108 [Smallanthus sonchifolius]